MPQTVTPSIAQAPSAGPMDPPVPQTNPRLRVQKSAVRTRQRHFLRAVRRISLLVGLDLAIVVGARQALHALREASWSAPAVLELFPPGFLGGWGSVGAFIVGLAFAGAYGSEERWASSAVVIKGAAIGAGLGLWQSLDTLGALSTSIRWLVTVTLVATLLVAMRALLRLAVLRHRLVAAPTDRAILVGDPLSFSGRQATQAVAAWPGMTSLGWLSERGGAEDYLGHPSAVWEVLCESGTDTVVLCGDVDSGIFDAVVEAAAVAGCRVLSLRPRGMLLASRPRLLGAGNLRMLELTFPASRAGQDGLKRVFDGVIAAALLVALSPLLVAISLWIKLDSPGPVLFIQDRVGQAGRVFPMWKFRTMSDGADALKEELAHLNGSGDPRLFKIPHDPRITRAGAVLRRWSLDELPQLWNVLRGQMSLVGPRPFFESDLAAYDDHHFIRLTVKPGLTGLWQVQGRSSIVDFEEVIQLDREYVERWSFGLDLKILASTLPAVLRRTGAF